MSELSAEDPRGLRDRLRLVPGVLDAEVGDLRDVPASVKVRVDAAADAAAVGQEIQRVLADHGVGSHSAYPTSRDWNRPTANARKATI